jgi:hypothetical protein
MFEVAERFYMELIPQAREMAAHARSEGRAAAAGAVEAVIEAILSRPEHAWFEEGAEGQTESIRREIHRRYGQTGDGGEAREGAR